MIRNGRAAAIPLALCLFAVSGALAQEPTSNPLDVFEKEMLEVTRQCEPWVVNIEAQLARPTKPKMKLLPGGSSAPNRRIGCGIAVDAGGGIITTASIVDGALKVQIRTRDGRTWPARIVGIDRRTNVALLSAAGARLSPARLGESDLVTPGSRVVVVGSIPPAFSGVKEPRDLQPVSYFGTVQADRGLVWGYSEVEMLQLNAPVLSGTSGAPVLNSEGRVVGMISGTLDDPASRESGASPGGLAGFIINDRVMASPVHSVSFAIPIEKAREIAGELAQHGRVDRGFLGLVVQRAEAGQPEKPGVLVREVMMDGPAARAGLKPGDLILSYAGQFVSIGDQLTFLVSATRPGSRVNMRFRRNGNEAETQAVIGRAPNMYTFGGPALGPMVPDGVPEARLVPGENGTGTGGNQTKRP